MEKEILHINGVAIALLRSREPIVTDAQSALDLFADIQYYDDCDRIALNKEAIAEDFFRLETGLAGEILQKFVNYTKKLAIVGDFSAYTSKALKDFIYECNHGKDIFFVNDEKAAADRLSAL